jgi:hypothetical protein
VLLRLTGVLCGWWRLIDAFDRNLFEDAADSLDRRL